MTHKRKLDSSLPGVKDDSNKQMKLEADESTDYVNAKDISVNIKEIEDPVTMGRESEERSDRDQSSRSTASVRLKQTRQATGNNSAQLGEPLEGTEDNPLSLSSDEEDDQGMEKDHSDDDGLEVLTSQIDTNNIYLSPKSCQFGAFHDVNLEESQKLLFKDQMISIRIPAMSLFPRNNKKADHLQISILYKDVTQFLIKILKTTVTISCTAKEITFSKMWLVKPTPSRTVDYGYPNDISFKNISKEQFKSMKPFIEAKSVILKTTMEYDDFQNDKIIAYYPHYSTSLISEAAKSTSSPVSEYSKKEMFDNFTKDVIKITANDFSRLEPNQYLNDSLVDFYMRYIKDNFIKEEDKSRIYFFNTFFYNILTLQNINEAYPKIAKWTKDIDIFSYDFLFIPICENFHWTLCLIAFPYQDIETSTSSNRPSFIFLDSLQSSKSALISLKIRQYLCLEWKNKKSAPSNGKIPERQFNAKNLPYHRANLPKQDNLCDCGVFLLHYMELFCRNPEKDFDSPMNKPKWFDISEVTEKREIIKSLIKRLRCEQDDTYKDLDKESIDLDDEVNIDQNDEVYIESDDHKDGNGFGDNQSNNNTTVNNNNITTTTTTTTTTTSGPGSIEVEISNPKNETPEAPNDKMEIIPTAYSISDKIRNESEGLELPRLESNIRAEDIDNVKTNVKSIDI